MGRMNETPPTDSTPEFDCLAAAAEWVGLEFTPQQLEQLDAYRQMLWDWNEKINLTRHTTMAKFAARDLLDTVELSKQIPTGDRVLDIGSGGGVPGLPLAILRPDLTVAVCDSVGKKSRVLEDLVANLALPVTVYPARAEQVLQITTQGTLIARGVASIKKLLTWLGPHWDAFDRLLLVKGKAWVEERGEARHYGLFHDLDLRRLASYESPLVGESVILSITHR